VILQTNSPQVSVPAENAVCGVCAIWAVTFVEDKDLGRVCPVCVKPLIDADMMLRIMSLVKL
jgi:hypothetical protein